MTAVHYVMSKVGEDWHFSCTALFI